MSQAQSKAAVSLEGIPPDVVAAFPRGWFYSANGMGRYTIDPKAVRAWREQQYLVTVANDVAANPKTAKPIGPSPIFRGDPAALPQLLAQPQEEESERLVESIIAATCALHAVDYDDIMGPSKRDDIVTARFHAIYEIHRQCPWMSSLKIGRLFGRDHTTILSALRSWPQRAKKFLLEAQDVIAGPAKSGPYTPEELDCIAELWNSGLGPRRISRIVGRPHGAIGGLAHRNPERFKPRGLGRNRFNREQIRAMSANGTPYQEIALIMGCSERTVRKATGECR